MPSENIIYVGDQAHVPYGARPIRQIQDFSETIARFLLNYGAKLIVVACNTASAAALKPLRSRFPDVPFVGMEPAVKPAAERTRTGKVAVLATPATFQGELYSSVIERFGAGVTFFQDTCPGLVELIEAGELDSPSVEKILHQALTPMLTQGIDTVVLGCTHYPFVIPVIQRLVGESVRVIDPAPAIARQTHNVLERSNLLNQDIKPGEIRFFTSADPPRFQTAVGKLIGESGIVGSISWLSDSEIRHPH